MNFTKFEIIVHVVALVALLITLAIMSVASGKGFSITLLLLGVLYYVVCVVLFKLWIIWRANHRR